MGYDYRYTVTSLQIQLKCGALGLGMWAVFTGFAEEMQSDCYVIGDPEYFIKDSAELHRVTEDEIKNAIEDLYNYNQKVVWIDYKDKVIVKIPHLHKMNKYLIEDGSIDTCKTSIDNGETEHEIKLVKLEDER